MPGAPLLRSVPARFARLRLRRGAVPLIQIDNVLYEAVPTIRQLKVPVQGMRLRKYPL